MPSPEEIAAAKKVLGLKANPASRSEDIVNAKKEFIVKKTQAAKAALNSSNPEDQIEAASEAGEEGTHPEDCKCTDCVQHPTGCKCGCHDEDAEAKSHSWSPSCDCPKCQAAYARENERRRKAGLSHESTQITNFIKALSQKNYSAANKYLQGVVEGKLKRSISKAYNK